MAHLLQVAFKNNKLNLDKFKDDMRAKLAEFMPDISISFEGIELTEKVLSQRATNPIEVRFSGMMIKVFGDFNEGDIFIY